MVSFYMLLKDISPSKSIELMHLLNFDLNDNPLSPKSTKNDVVRVAK